MIILREITHTYTLTGSAPCVAAGSFFFFSLDGVRASFTAFRDRTHVSPLQKQKNKTGPYLFLGFSRNSEWDENFRHLSELHVWNITEGGDVCSCAWLGCVQH